MPKYDFTCINCETTKEVDFRMDEPQRVECQQCGNSMTRVYTAPSVQFKGGGWGGQG